MGIRSFKVAKKPVKVKGQIKASLVESTVSCIQKLDDFKLLVAPASVKLAVDQGFD